MCNNCCKEIHDEAHCWMLHPKLKRKKFNNKGKQKTNNDVQQDLGFDSSGEINIACYETSSQKR